MSIPAGREADAFYREFFERELVRLSSQRGSPRRVQWLADHLIEYVDRWLGFCGLAEGSSSFENVPGFTMIERGAAAMQEELAGVQSPSDVEDAWTAFHRLVSAFRTSGGKREPEELAKAAREIRNRLSSVG